MSARMWERIRTPRRGVLLALHLAAFLAVGTFGILALGAYSGNHVAHITRTTQALEWALGIGAAMTLACSIGCFGLWRHRRARLTSLVTLLSWLLQLGLVIIAFSIKY